MTDMLLTPDQAADLLAVSPLTLANWRNHRKGPPYVLLGTNPDPSGHGGKHATRYRLSDLEAFIASRMVDPRSLTPPKTRRVTPRVLTDAEWAAVKAAVRPRDRMGRLYGLLNVNHKHRKLLDDVMEACTLGRWPDGGGSSHTVRHRLRKGVRTNGWVLQAFDALAAFPDFPFVLAVQYVVVRRGRRRDLPTTALRLRTDAHGPTHGRGGTNSLTKPAARAVHREDAFRDEDC